MFVTVKDTLYENLFDLSCYGFFFHRKDIGFNLIERYSEKFNYMCGDVIALEYLIQIIYWSRKSYKVTTWENVTKFF